MTPQDLEALKAAAKALISYSASCADARTWGGPTIYPPAPLTEAQYTSTGKTILALLEERAALVGALTSIEAEVAQYADVAPNVGLGAYEACEAVRSIVSVALSHPHEQENSRG